MNDTERQIIEGPLFSTSDVAELAGVTYRQLDYWVRNDVVTPTYEAHGSGRPRRWSALDAERIIAIGRAIAECHEVGLVTTNDFVRRIWLGLGESHVWRLDVVAEVTVWA